MRGRIYAIIPGDETIVYTHHNVGDVASFVATLVPVSCPVLSVAHSMLSEV